MFFTYVVRPGEAPEGRGPQFEPIFSFIANYSLRLGLFILFSGYVCLLMTVSAGTDDPLALLNVLRASPESAGKCPLWAGQLGCGLLIIGYLTLLAFQSLTDDDSSIKQSRGYRTGSKLLQQGSSFGVFSSILSLLIIYSSNYYFDDLFMNKNITGGTNWLIFFTARLCDAIAMFLFGGAFFFLETYHSEGAGEAWGWLGAICFHITAISEVLALGVWGTSIQNILDSIYSIMLGICIIICFLWSLLFEPIIHYYDVKMTQSAMRNEYYKSRNAMAYYGPAVVNADGEIDIAAAARQAQACLNCTNSSS